jgi:hypothetical protein
MLTIGNYVRHQNSGCCGKVVGHGHQISDEGAYLPTLQVLIENACEQGHHHEVVEDITTLWQPVQVNSPLAVLVE